MRKAIVAVTLLGLVLSAGAVAACREHEVGYFSPQFTADGTAIVVIVRDARALVTGLGYETFTPPARVFVSRDRFSLVRIRLADRHTEVLTAFPPSPIEGRWIQTYRPGIYGSAQGHLRWATPEALEYEIGVTVARQPTSDTYIVRRRWNPTTKQWQESRVWEPGFTGMGGDAPSQLHGTREVVAVRAGGAMPCAVVIVTEGQESGEAVAETPDCRKAHPNGYAVTALADVLRRTELERIAHLESTHQGLVAEARARGLSEGDAALEAIRGMQRLGLYPKPSTLVATRVSSADPSASVFVITDEEFRVGLFADLRQALDHPGEEIEKSSGDYIVHSSFDTSRQLNAFLKGRDDVTFFVEADGALWRVRLDRR